jgi:hypothetical protein
MSNFREFPIYWSQEKIDLLENWLSEAKPFLKKGHQGLSVREILPEWLFKSLFLIHPKVKSISINYYACQGKADTMILCGLRFHGEFSSNHKINGNLFKGFKCRVSEYSCGGHLTSYYSF